MGNLCCPESGPLGQTPSSQGHNRISRQLDQRVANYAATGVVPLRDARLSELPAFVEQLGDKVKTLDVTNNKLDAIPPSIACNFNLVKLVLSQNQLRSLPEEIGQLTSLKVLMLDNNSLQSLPASICGLAKLESLSVASNAVDSLPEELGQLRKLKTIMLSHNKLRELPSALSRCSTLEEVHAADNYLTTIPAELGGLDRLKLCNFDGNRIEAVPTDVLVHCIALHTLSLHNNPITAADLEQTEGYDVFEQRRRTKFDKQIAAGVLLGPGGLDEGIDRQTTRN